MVSTTTKTGAFSFDNRFMDAAGVYCTIRGELAGIDASAAGSFVIKTGTLTARTGNPEPRYADASLGLINSMGLPNNGFQCYLDYVTEFQSTPNSKHHFLPLVDMSEEETHTILKAVQDSGHQGLVELNLLCPNVPGKPQIAYDFETTETLLRDIFTYFIKPLGVELPPYFDIAYFDRAAMIFNQFPFTFVNCTNSIGSGLIIEDETVLIKPKNGFGGIGGDYIKPVTLINAHVFHQRLNPSIQTIGTGGIETGRDASEHILRGASMVQLGIILHQEGPAVFEHITNELKATTEEKGYKSLEDFRGKLKYIDQL